VSGAPTVAFEAGEPAGANAFKEAQAMQSLLSRARSRVRKPSLLCGSAIVAATLAVGGVAFATIPTNGVISGCYLKSGGTLRVIDATTGKCSSKETSLNWNVQGAPGSQGPQGPPGEQGPKGDTGSAGAAGISGYEVVTVEDDYVSPFDPERMDVIAQCPAGKKIISGSYGLYQIPPGYAPQWTPPDRVAALIRNYDDGSQDYYVTTFQPLPSGHGAKLRAVIVCASVAS
jgi:hypothetical protein